MRLGCEDRVVPGKAGTWDCARNKIQSWLRCTWPEVTAGHTVSISWLSEPHQELSGTRVQLALDAEPG